MRLRLVSRIAALCALAAIAVALAMGLLVPAGHNAPKVVTVERGDSVPKVAAMLHQDGLIRSAQIFTAAAYVSGKWRRIQAGRFELTPTMTPLEILDAISRGSRKAWRWLTVPEGYTLRQIAEEVGQEKLVSADDFYMQAQLTSDFDPAFAVPRRSLEGYLFPDTYRVDVGQSAQAIISQMLRRFDSVVWQGLFRGNPTYKGRSVSDIIILASLVEGEARHEKERPIIAGVLMNRLSQGIRLECDATVQYALGDGRKPRLINEDLSVPSEYNTYQHEGLPPGPICSPGEASIRAAMEPARVPYMYYVARPDGSHVFSVTFAQHQAAIAQIRRKH